MPGKVGRDAAGLMAFPWLCVAIVITSAFIFPPVQSRGLLFWFWTSLVLALLGVAILAYARLPLYRQRRFFAVGPGAVPKERRRSYYWGWLLVLVAVIIQCVLLTLTR